MRSGACTSANRRGPTGAGRPPTTSCRNCLLVESVRTPKGPRQNTICSLGDLSPRPRQEWLKLARKIEDALVGQGDLLDPDDGEIADIVGRVRARRAKRHGDHGIKDAALPAPPQGSGGALIKVDPTRVATERHP